MSPAISSSVRPSRGGAGDEAARDAGALALQDALQAQALFVAGDLARDAHVFERRHVDHVAAGQRDVRGDARALLAQRLLGDLNDDLLAFFEQVADRGLALAVASSARWARNLFDALRCRRARCVVAPAGSARLLAAPHAAAHAAVDAVLLGIAGTRVANVGGQRRLARFGPHGRFVSGVGRTLRFIGVPVLG